MIVLLSMTVLTSCRTIYSADPVVDHKKVILNMVPEHPELPEWPKLNWISGDGIQSISNKDALKIIEYWENLIPQYLYEVDVYKKDIAVLMDAM